MVPTYNSSNIVSTVYLQKQTYYTILNISHRKPKFVSGKRDVTNKFTKETNQVGNYRILCSMVYLG